MNNPDIEAIVEEFKTMSDADYKDLHDSVLMKLDEIKKHANLKDRSAATMKFLRFLIGSIDFPFAGDPRSFLISGASKKGLIINPKGYKREGEMVFFRYFPESRSKMTYWDMYPMVLIIKKNKDGFEGLNLHYLEEKHRERLMVNMSTMMMGDRKNQNAKTNRNLPRLKIIYDRLKRLSRFRYYRPCYKKYKYKNIRGRMLVIEPKYWDIAMYLPLQKFVKRGTNRVWSDSRRTIRRNM